MEHVNEVRLLGKVATPPQWRESESGLAVSFQLRIERPGETTADTLDCITMGDVTSAVKYVEIGALLGITGRLRRRSWRAPGGPTSRVEVEVLSVFHGAVN